MNQDPRAAPMAPVRRDGAEVWQKPLADGGLALVLFSRNVSTPSTPLTMPLPGTATATVAAPPKAGDQLSIDASCDLSVDFSGGAIKLRAQPLLCVGSIGTCTRASTSFWDHSPRISHPCAVPSLPRCAACSTWCPCVWIADWCLQPDVMTNSRLQARARARSRRCWDSSSAIPRTAPSTGRGIQPPGRSSTTHSTT